MKKEVRFHPKKLDWILITRQDQLKRIMLDNAVYISIPPLGSNIEALAVIGDDQVFVERAIRALMVIVCIWVRDAATWKHSLIVFLYRHASSTNAHYGLVLHSR
jgi:hypothetical protein